MHFIIFVYQLYLSDQMDNKHSPMLIFKREEKDLTDEMKKKMCQLGCSVSEHKPRKNGQELLTQLLATGLALNYANVVWYPSKTAIPAIW